LFHVWLTWETAQLTGVSAGIYGLLVALAVGGTMVIFFVAVVTAFCQREMLTTSIGWWVSVFTALFYLVRAVEEFILFENSHVIADACTVTGAIYLALAARVRVGATGLPSAS
jgi:membrane-associated HD superfamily phosphohydrolase